MWNKPCVGYGLKIQEMREKKGLTRSGLAKILGSTETMMENLELSKCHPTIYFIKELAMALNTNTNELKKFIWCDQESEECRISE